MKNLNLLLLFLLLFGLNLRAQVQTVKMEGMVPVHYKDINKKSELPILGSPYLSEAWMYGELAIEGAPKMDGMLRYNIDTDEIEMIHKTDTFYVSKPYKVDQVLIGRMRFEYAMYVEKKDGVELVGATYFEVLSKGKIDLLLRRRVEIENNSYSTTYMGGGGNGRDYYSIKESYYYRTAEDPTVRRLKRKKRKLKSLFGEKFIRVDEFIKENHFNLMSSKDLVKVFNFCNQL